MRKRRINMLLIFFPLFISSCLSISDRLVVVKGNLVYPEEIQFDGCEIELFLSQDDALISRRKIKQTFQTDFTVSPFDEEYYFLIRCENCAHVFRSENYMINKNYLINNPIDLGQIQWKCN
ncbi:MAG: hypothetical protein WC450_04070 [Candidatus Omnitrophota bacterium]|jgi:hypothetical protein